MAAQLKKERKSATPDIQCIEVVGSLGIPDLYFPGIKIPLNILFGDPNKNYRFHNTDLHEKVLYGFHAYVSERLSNSSLALNEKRKPFEPTIWTLPPGDTKTTLRQVWFAGCHTDVGGGQENHALSNIALYWMIDQVKSIPESTLQFNKSYLVRSQTTIAKSTTTQTWGCAAYKDSYSGFWTRGGISPRTPTIYYENAKMEVHKSVDNRRKLDKTQSEPDIGKLKFTTLGSFELKMQKNFQLGFPV